MPPKGIMPNLFGERKVYIGKDLCDMKPLGEIIKDAITVKQEWPDISTIRNFEPICVTLKVEFNGKIRKAIQKFLGKPRKTTYKTLRHDCAKRNGRIQ